MMLLLIDVWSFLRYWLRVKPVNLWRSLTQRERMTECGLCSFGYARRDMNVRRCRGGIVDLICPRCYSGIQVLREATRRTAAR